MIGEQFSFDLTPQTSAILGARTLLGEWLSSIGVSGAGAEDLAVVLSELCANAVAATDRPQAKVAVRAWLDGSAVVIEVENAHSTTGGGVVFRHDRDPLRGQGQGLLIVSAYTDSVEVIPPTRDAGLIVRCRKEIVVA